MSSVKLLVKFREITGKSFTEITEGLRLMLLPLSVPSNGVRLKPGRSWPLLSRSAPVWVSWISPLARSTL